MISMVDAVVLINRKCVLYPKPKDNFLPRWASEWKPIIPFTTTTIKSRTGGIMAGTSRLLKKLEGYWIGSLEGVSDLVQRLTEADVLAFERKRRRASHV
jgi:hypothetical protein